MLKRSAEERFLYGSKGWISVGQALGDAARVRRAYPQVAGHGVMLRGLSDEETILGLLAFDGFAKKILLIGSGISEDQEAEFRRMSGITHVADLAEEDLREGLESEVCNVETKWIVPTSGTTGVPKLVEHSLESLAATVRRDRDKGSEFVWGMIYDITRFAGIQVLLQAVIGGSAVAVVNDRQDTDGIAARFVAAGVNALSATPSMWRKLVMSGLIDRVDLRIITLGGEAPDQKILTELDRRFPEAKITTIYASTEAGVGFAVSDGKVGFPVNFIDAELPGGTLLRVEQGRLFLRKAASAAAFLGLDEQIADQEGWIDTQDLVEQQGDRFLFLGRANGAINVGGQKVYPGEVEAVIQEVSGVCLVAVFGRRNPIMGSVVEARVIPAADVELASLKDSILNLCKERLASYKVPASVKIVDHIPLTTAGKIKRS